MLKLFRDTKPTTSRFALFASLLFFITVSDAIMSYVAPVVIEDVVKDPFLFGLILSSSSFFGIFFDFFIAQRLNSKTYIYFSFGAIVFALLFPLIFLTPSHSIVLLVIAMVIWSVYYEFKGFSQVDFIHRNMTKDQHTMAWSFLVTLSSIAYLIGPGIAVYVIDKYVDLPFYISIFFVLIAFLLFLVLRAVLHRQRKTVVLHAERARPLVLEFKILYRLLQKTWILVLFQIAILLFDVSIWSTGILYIEQLRETNPVGGLFMIIYGIPTFIIGFLVSLMPVSLYGKKRVSFFLAILVGVFTILLGIVTNIYLVLSLVFIASTLSGMSLILIYAVFEDYVSRLDGFENDMASLSQLSGNIAYTVGPILFGFLAAQFSYKFNFVAAGSLILVASLLAIVLVPRKVKMPQKELFDVV